MKPKKTMSSEEYLLLLENNVKFTRTCSLIGLLAMLVAVAVTIFTEVR